MKCKLVLNVNGKRPFVWFGFYGISNTIGYLTPNPFYTYKQFYFKLFNLT